MIKITAAQIDKVQLMESRLHYLTDIGSDELARHKDAYHAYREELGISVIQAENVAWQAVKAWNNGQDLKELIYIGGK